MKVLLLEDDQSLGELLNEYLRVQNDTLWVQTVKAALDAVQEQKFDLLLLDIGLPDGDGFSFLKTLRDYRDETPAIFITATNGSAYVKKGFAIGCDDYIKKPFDFEELEARINHVKKRYCIDRESLLYIDDETFFDAQNATLHVNQIQHVLRPMEAKVLLYFVTNKERFISYEELSRALWAFDETPDEATIRSYIKNLRRLFTKDFFRNQRGVGYRFERL